MYGKWLGHDDGHERKDYIFDVREVLKQMLQQGIDAAGLRGTILNMSSVLAFSPEPKYFAAHAYAASKGAIISLSKVHGQHITRRTKFA